MYKTCTLVYVQRKGEVLLGLKKRGFAKSLWNGFGGKVEPGESLESAARRELEEECGIKVGEMKKTGLFIFSHEEDARPHIIHVFCTADFHGEPIETEEMKPQWFTLDELPFDSMWSSDRPWLKRLLEGECFIGHFHFREFKHILSHNLQEVDSEHFSC